MGGTNAAGRSMLVALLTAIVVLATACAPTGEGDTTTNTVATVDGARACLGRLDGQADARDVACFDTSDVQGASGLQVGDCVRAKRHDESRRIERITVVEPKGCTGTRGS